MFSSNNKLSNIDTLSYADIVGCSPPKPTQPPSVTTSTTGIVDSGANNIYYSSDAPITNNNMKAPKVKVGTANSQVARSASTSKTAITQLVHTLPTTGHIIPTFKHTLIGIGHICDAGCTVTLSKRDVTVFAPGRKPILTGWHETTDNKIWHSSLFPDTAQLLPAQPNT